MSTTPASGSPVPGSSAADELPTLDSVDQRILGALLEKQRTVPASYPLSLNALRTACNQTSSREPVTDYDNATLIDTTKALRERGLLRTVWAGGGQRALKYHQVLDEVLGLQPDETALLTVLLLRGEQAPGELKTRTDRLHPFADRAAVAATLTAMAARTPALVRELPRRAGQHDARWQHLLGRVEAVDDSVEQPAPPAPAKDSATRKATIIDGYTAVAQAYAEKFENELDQMPFETWLLDRIVGLADGHPIADAGCGPGHITAHLAAAGADATGYDLAPAMIETAQARFPQGSYQVGDLLSLLRPPNDDGWGAVLAWYSLVHTPEAEMPAAIAALSRVLRPGGWLLLALHAGREVHHLDTWLGHDVDLDFVMHPPRRVAEQLSLAGLVDVEWYRRAPITTRGETTERCYVLGRKAN